MPDRSPVVAVHKAVRESLRGRQLRSGNLSLYPAPPPPQVVSSRLTGRLLARLPVPVELQPN